LSAEAKIKTDKIDSALLAQLLRANLIPAAYVPGPITRQQRRRLRQRVFLARVCSMLKNRLHVEVRWMRKAFFRSAVDVEVQEVQVPEPGEDEVLVEVKACAICASDEEAAAITGNPGHEVAGVIRRVGKKVEAVVPGDEVTIYWRLGCGDCGACQRGYEVHCANPPFTLWGGYADYVVAPASACLPLPEGLGFRQGSLLTDTVGTPLSAVEAAQVNDAVVVVLGCGPLGLASIQLAKGAGARMIIGLDPIPFRREKARACGADEVIDPINTDPIVAVKAPVGPMGIDACICTIRDQKAIQQAIEALAPGGRFITIAGHPKSIPMNRLFCNTWYFKRERYPEIARLAASGKVKLEPLITHTFPLEQVAEAFRVRFQQREKSLKVIVEP